MAEPLLRLWFFEDVRAEYGGVPVRIAARPLCAVLLARLALQPGRRVARKALATDLWPDESDSARAGGNLRRHLSALLAALPPLPAGATWIEADGAYLTWSLAQPSWCDALELEAALANPDAAPAAFAAAADFMPGYVNDWVLAQRENYRARAVERLLTMCVEQQDDDRIDAALECAEAAIRLEPLREDAVQLALELHGERGDPIAASALFATFAERLRRELDAAPAPATVELIERVRAAAGERRDRLPRVATTFVGRGEAVENLDRALERSRCVTIVGPGGLGKTRLALETANAVSHRFADGSYFIDLSTLPAQSDIADSVVRGLDLPSELASAGPDGVKRFLRARRAIVIFDNCEHVREPCAAFAHDLLETAPRITILATSRVPLGIRAESVFRLAPLSVAEGRALFVERAASAGLAHAWSAADLERVDRVCAALDRSPLAIELAAGLAANMSLADIERSLPDRFGLLRTSDPSLPHRHRALEAAIAWSFELLSDAEKRLFARLAVFAASFTFDAALAVAGEGKRPFLSLVEKSMVQRDETNADRYRLLFSLGEFARQRFAEDPQAGDVRARHARYFAELAIAARIDERTRDQKRLLKTIDLELPDLRSALRTLFAGSAPDAALGIEATLALNYYHSARGYFAEGLTALDAARQAAPPGSLDFARVQAAAGKLLFRQRRFAAAKATDEAALAIFRERGTRADVARLLTEIAAVMISLRDPEAARALLDEALPLAVLEGLENTQAVILGNLAVLANAEGDQARFVALTTESARLSKRAGDRRFLARSLDDLAGAEFVAGRHDAAIAMLREALAIVHSVDDVPLAAEITCDLGDVLLAAGRASEARDHFAKSLDAAASLALNYTLGQSLIGLGGVALESGDPRLAARLLGAGASVAAATVPTSVNTSLIARTRAALIERLGEAEFERECRLGEFLEVEDAIALAKGRAARDGTGAPA